MSYKGIFITGTDTGVGKTVVAAAIARYFSLSGMSVGVLKPVTSGALKQDGKLVSQDAELLRWASGCGAPPHITSPYVLRDPIAPSEAALREGIDIRFDLIRDAFDQLASCHDLVIVEGAGGLLVPLAPDLLVADLPLRLGLPLIIVARPDLGTVNHTLLTCECSMSRNIETLGIIINGQVSNPDGAEEYAPRLLARLSPAPLLGVLPRLVSSDERDLVERLTPIVADMHLETLFAVEVNLDRT